jgi:predicted RNA-binding protein with TRAM domain
VNTAKIERIGKEIAAVLETHSRFHVLATDAVGFGYRILVTDVDQGETVKIEVREPL